MSSTTPPSPSSPCSRRWSFSAGGEARGSAERTGRAAAWARGGSGDLLVGAGREQPVDGNGLGDVLETLLPEALQHEVRTDALGGGGADHDLAARGRGGEPGGHVSDGARGGESPALAARAAELRRAHQGLAGVDPHVQLDGL